MAPNESELEQFIRIWNSEADKTQRLLETLPEDKYDFRPDAGGRSLGELAWHLAEIDGVMTWGIEQGKFEIGMKPPGLERPRDVKSLAPGYRRVHEEALRRVRNFTPEQLDRAVPFFNGHPMTGRETLWGALLYHMFHHRGQLHLMCRLAGGTPPGLFGPTREEMEAMRKAFAAKQAASA